jgi:HTH-type transcriptional regulator / antitoxin HipB
MKYSLYTPEEALTNLSQRARTLRLTKRWKRSTLAQRSGVTPSSLRRFEQTGEVSMKNFLKIVFALGRLDETENLLLIPDAQSISDLERNEKKIPERGSI